MSVLDPSEIPGHPQAAPDGPTSKELAAFLERIFRHEKAAAIGIASLHDDADESSIRSAYTLIEGAIRGVKGR
jgi:arginase family enzyme